jgi:two-component system LytT family response regulator
VALIEDEVPALEHLERMLARIRPSARIVARLRTVRQTRAWLAEQAECDLILADIQLGDGLSLDALAEVDCRVPVVFTTAFDHHLAPALAGNGIAYLLKPIDADALAVAVEKHERLEQHFVGGSARSPGSWPGIPPCRGWSGAGGSTG